MEFPEVDDCRDAFEVYATDEKLRLKTNAVGNFVEGDTAFAWDVWRAAWNSRGLLSDGLES